MPLDYDANGRLARVRKIKDKDSRSTTSSSSGRKHRDSSASSSRTPVPPDYHAAPSDHQSTVSLDQLPELPESGPDSPSSSASPLLRTSSNISTSTSMASPAYPQHPTPAALQPYLESEVDLPTMVSSAQETPKAEKPKEDPMVQAVTKIPSQSSDSRPPVPGPKPSVKSAAAALVPSTSSPRQPPPPSLNQQHSTPVPVDSKPRRLSSVGYTSSPPATAQAYPVGPGPHGHPVIPSPPFAYLPLPQPAGLPSNQHLIAPQGPPYYLNYGSLPPEQPLSHHPHNIISQRDNAKQSHQPQILPATSRPMELVHQGPWDRNLGSSAEISDDNPVALFHRIQRAIPDIHSLMNLYRETCGQLEASEIHIREMEEQKAAAVKQQDIHISRLERDLKDLINRHSAETNQLRCEIESMSEKHEELHHRLSGKAKLHQDLKSANESLRAELKETEKKREEDKSALTHAFSLDKDKMVAEHRTNQRSLNDQLQAYQRTAEVTLSSRLAEASRISEKEKQDLENGWVQQRRLLEDRHTRTRRDLENALDSKRKVVQEERQTYLQAREGWDREHGTLLRRWEEERAILQKTSEEQRKALTIKYQREKDDILRRTSQPQNESEMGETNLKLQREIEALKAGWDADKFKFQTATADFKTTARTLNEHNNKLQKLTEAFGDTLDPKSK